jgi:L-threonylcarbamoyladenylate synthase
VYGLGCRAFCESSVGRVHALKGAALERPFILLIPRIEWLGILTSPNDVANALGRAFWPGPLTLVLEAIGDLPRYLLGEERTIAVRHSSSEFVRDLFGWLDEPLVSTSANPENFPPAASAEEVMRYFAAHVETIDALVECSSPMIGRASTVVSLAGDKVSILREGPIPGERVREVLRDGSSSPGNGGSPHRE